MKRTHAIVAAAALGLAACNNPPLSLRFKLTDGESQQCIGDSGSVTTSCQDVTMLCDAYLSIRVLPPNDPEAPYISVCRPLTGAQRKLCAIAGIDLPEPAMPVAEQTLEIQMAVFPASDIRMDPDTNEPVCPRVQFGANGLPMPVLPICDDPDPFACPRVPAVGGRSYYHPGDDKTVVDLGCTNLEQLTDATVCNGESIVSVTATVNDFDNPVSSVDKAVADRLSVSVGEPKPLADTYVLNPADSFELERNAASTPSWSGLLTEVAFTSVACVEVLEDGAETTTALTCDPLGVGKNDFDIEGYFVKKATLTQILAAIGKSSFPDSGGLVIGIAVDEDSNPLAGQPVTCSPPGGSSSPCTIQYLNTARTGTVSGSTSMSGVFVSTDAAFGTVFSLPLSPQQATAVGGIVEGKVTIVVLRYQDLDPG